MPPAESSCVHQRGAPGVESEPEYSTLGQLLLFFGITPRPVRVRHRCRACGLVFDGDASAAEPRDQPSRA